MIESKVIAQNTKRIRLSKDLTQAQVAKKSKISLPTYSKIESGTSLPTMKTLYKVARGMGVNIYELLVQVRELKHVRFRAQKKLKKRDHILARAANWLDDFNFLIKETKSEPNSNLSKLHERFNRISENKKPEEVARLARKAMNLDDKEPIHDISGLFASTGIKVLTYNLASDAFFGMSIAESEGGPAVVVNVWDRIPVERWIFSAAHELGHLILHLHSYDVDQKEEDEEQEKEANAFASEFLMPHEGFIKEWYETAGLDLWVRILKVKRIYHVSYKTILYRLVEMGVFDDGVWKKTSIFLKKRYSIQQVSKNFEPEKLQEYDFITDWLERLVRQAIENEVITLSRAADILNISLMDMRQRASLWAEEKIAS